MPCKKLMRLERHALSLSLILHCLNMLTNSARTPCPSQRTLLRGSWASLGIGYIIALETSMCVSTTQIWKVDDSLRLAERQRRQIVHPLEWCLLHISGQTDPCSALLFTHGTLFHQQPKFSFEYLLLHTRSACLAQPGPRPRLQNSTHRTLLLIADIPSMGVGVRRVTSPFSSIPLEPLRL